jgi:hypothetical protein
MKISELLRQLLDVITAAEQEQNNHNIVPNAAELTAVNADNEDHTDGTTMIPPLQQKLELLKKSNDVDSYYDDECDSSHDELNDIKKNAGIAFIAGEDNDIGD